ncbi:MAG: hypothetical protein ABIQ12_09590 [Opitutaceae bacterium]
MNSTVSPWLACIRLVGFSALLAGAGCIGIFAPKHRVLVDSISAPNVAKPAGQSYRLVAKKSTLTQNQVDVKVVEACLDAALIGQGLYKAPSTVAPDLFIEVGYGTDTAGRTDPSGRETFLQLSARDNPSRALDKTTGAEQWDVRVAVLGITGRVETAMPLLSSVASAHLASNTHMETKIEVPQNAPMVTAVREAAIKNLEVGGSAAPAAGAAMKPVK